MMLMSVISSSCTISRTLLYVHLTVPIHFLFLQALGKSVSFVFSISLRHFRFSADLNLLCLAVKIVMIDNKSSASSPDSVSSTLMSEPSTTTFVLCLTKKRQSRSLWVTTTSSIFPWYDCSKMDVKPLRFQLRPDPMSLMSSWKSPKQK